MIRTKLKNRRVFMGFTQADVAQAADIDRGYYANVENGKRNCSIPVWIKILKILEIPKEEFMEYVETKEEKGV